MRGLGWCTVCLLLHYCTLLSSAEEGSWSIQPIHIPGLICDSVGFHFIVYPKGTRHLSVKLTAVDKQGGAHVLFSHRDCGTWINRRPSGSVALRAFYNGCYVYEENDEKVMTIFVEKEYNPGNWTLPQIKELRCPKLGDRSPERCSVPNMNRIACASPSVSREICTKQGCCFDVGDQINPCYYGNKVTIQCTQDEQISVAISKAFTRPPLKIDSVRITGEEACKPILRTNEFILFQFSPSTCGTTYKKIGVVIYEIVMLANIDVKKLNETSVPMRLHIQCSLVSNDLPTKNTDVLTPSPLANGIPEALTLQMRFAKDALYLKYYVDGDYPVVKLLQGFPMEVWVLQRIESNLTLSLHECWATPTEDPNRGPRWPFLVNGCSSTGVHNKSHEVSPARYLGLQLSSHYNPLISAVKPTESSLNMGLNGLVYFHCRASVCFQSALDPCVPLCQQRETRAIDEAASNKTILISSQGPLYVPAAEETKASGTGPPVVTGLLAKEWARIVLVVCIAVLLVGICVIKKRCKMFVDDKSCIQA